MIRWADHSYSWEWEIMILRKLQMSGFRSSLLTALIKAALGKVFACLLTWYRMKSNVDQFVFIMDLHNISFSNVDTGQLKMIILILSVSIWMTLLGIKNQYRTISQRDFIRCISFGQDSYSMLFSQESSLSFMKLLKPSLSSSPITIWMTFLLIST